MIIIRKYYFWEDYQLDHCQLDHCRSHKYFYIIFLSNLLTLSVPDEGHFRNEPCALNWISTFLLIYTVRVAMLQLEICKFLAVDLVL